MNGATAVGVGSPDDRNEFLDLLRGVAILGILVVNLAWYSRPALYEELGPERGWSDPRDRAAHRAITVFDELEFLTIFSFVFGAGFALTRLKRLDSADDGGTS